MSFETAKERISAWKVLLLERTDGGLLLLQHLYPHMRVQGAKSLSFKIRNEKSESALCKLSAENGIWWTIDYGDDQKWRNPFDQYAYERGLSSATFTDILKEIAKELIITLP